jgi:hypothetical protein
MSTLSIIKTGRKKQTHLTSGTKGKITHFVAFGRNGTENFI